MTEAIRARPQSLGRCRASDTEQLRGLPEPVGLSRALLLPTLSQQPVNICRGEPTVLSPLTTHTHTQENNCIPISAHAFSVEGGVLGLKL